MDFKLPPFIGRIFGDTDTPAAEPTPATQGKDTPNGPSWNVKTTTVTGTPRRETLRMDNTPESLAAQKEMSIACPVLKGLVQSGKLHVDAEGRVQTPEMLNALRERGIDEAGLKILKGITYFANSPQDVLRNKTSESFDVMHLRSGLTMHNADSNILSRGHFDEQAFNEFTRHATNGMMTLQSFADAIAAQTVKDTKAQGPVGVWAPEVFGKNAVLAEYPMMLEILGKPQGPNGEMAISVKDLKAFWKDGIMPDGSAKPGSVHLPPAIRNYFETLLRAVPAEGVELGKIAREALAASNVQADPLLMNAAFTNELTASGMASKGIALATGDKRAPNAMELAGVAAGKAANCPYLKSGGPMKSPLPANLTEHV